MTRCSERIREKHHCMCNFVILNLLISIKACFGVINSTYLTFHSILDKHQIVPQLPHSKLRSYVWFCYRYKTIKIEVVHSFLI